MIRVHKTKKGGEMRIMLLSIIGIALIATAGHAQEKQIVEQWECSDRYKYKGPVIVRLKRLRSGNSETGEIEVAGTTQAAKFSVKGFDRRWNFGPTLLYSFVIQPNRDGIYRSPSSSQYFKCERR